MHNLKYSLIRINCLFTKPGFLHVCFSRLKVLNTEEERRTNQKGHQKLKHSAFKLA